MLAALASEDWPLLAIAGVLALLLGAPSGYYLLRAGRKAALGLRLWRQNPDSVLAAANADGLVELVGEAAPGENRLRAPFTELPCLACRYEVEEWVSSGNSSHWKTLHEGVESVPFWLEDGSNRIPIEPDGADHSLADADSVEVPRDETAPEPIASFLEGIDVEPGSGTTTSIGPLEVSSGDRRRYSEARIDPGDAVHVYGPVERDFTVAEGAGEVNAAVRADGGAGPFVVSNTDETGAIRRTLLDAAGDLAWGLLFLVGVAVVAVYALGAVGGL